jgi:hypothetical protein
MEAPDVVDAKLREVVHQVSKLTRQRRRRCRRDVDEVDGYDMPMSIYSQFFFHHFCK